MTTQYMDFTVKEMYQMKLHEVITLRGGIDVIRVVGGWIYRFDISESESKFVFVPENKPRTLFNYTS